MPGSIRPNKKCAKIAYAILKTPVEKQQKNDVKPSQRLIKQWFRDSFTAQ